jgi:hypothetical protein
LALGVPHPDYLMEMLNSKQLRDWEVVYSIEPFGQYPEYVRMGVIASTLINIKLKKGAKKLTPLSFVPPLYGGKKTDEKQTIDDMKEGLSSMSGKKVK